MSLPLEGYRVIELAQIHAGPYYGLQLARLRRGAYQVEAPGTGELLRKRLPAKHGTNYGFLMLNTSKKSVSLNLKDARGREILYRMLARRRRAPRKLYSGSSRTFGTWVRGPGPELSAPGPWFKQGLRT
jgi:crotonobetainyl-CoA:carnitine CoA-transferase CaiB-like acyl-CoA transferase